MSATLLQPVSPISHIRHTVGSQYTYSVRWLCGHVTTECGNGPDRAQAHRDADAKRAATRSCYACGYRTAEQHQEWLDTGGFVPQSAVDAVYERCTECDAVVSPEELACSACYDAATGEEDVTREVA